MSLRASLAVGKRGQYHHGDLAVALVGEALEVVRARGAEALSLRQVAQAVGVSPSAAYAHFEDKHALLTAVALEGEHVLGRALSDAVAAVEGDDDQAAMRRFLGTGQAYIGWAIAEPHLFRHTFGPYCPHLGDPAAGVDGPPIPPGTSVAYDLLCQSIADVRRRGLLSSDNTEGLDLMLWTTVHGFASLVLDGHLPLSVADLLYGSIARNVFNERGQALAAVAAAG